MNAPDLPPLQRLIARPPSPDIQVLACMLAQSQRSGAQPLIRGLSPASFAVMCATTLPGVNLDNGHSATPAFDEFEELYELLMTHASPADRMANGWPPRLPPPPSATITCGRISACPRGLNSTPSCASAFLRWLH